MKLLHRFTLFPLSTILISCTATPQLEYDALASAQQETGRLLAYQAEELQIQRQQLMQLQNRNSELTEALFDLQQELETLKQAAPRARQAAADAVSNDAVSPNETQAAPPQLDDSGRVILGKAEWVWFDLLGRSVQARIDDDAKSSSIRADEIQLFERDGDEWVKFSLATAASTQQTPVFYEAPLLRKVRVRTAAEDVYETRPVVRLKIKLGDLIDSTEFTLINRESAAYPVVLGRSFLRDIAVVDGERQYTQPTHSENSPL